MITFDFFNDSSTELVEKFCEYFQLDKETVEDYFIRVNPDTLTPETLVRKFDLKLNEYDSSQLQIVCRHMTTSTEDEIHSFVDKGILDLRTMLQENTPLSQFLLEHKIKVDVDEHKIEKLSIEDGKGNKAKLARTKDNGIKIEYSSTVLT